MGRKVFGWHKRPLGVSVGRRKPSRSGEQIRPNKRWGSEERLLSLLGREGGHLFKADPDDPARHREEGPEQSDAMGRARHCNQRVEKVHGRAKPELAIIMSHLKYLTVETG